MNLLESFQKEIETKTKVICLTPYDRDFSFKFFSIEEYIECESLSNLWTTGFVEEFEFSYHGENRILNNLDEYKFKDFLTLLQKEEDIDNLDFEELTKTLLKWEFNYTGEVEIYFHLYNFYVIDEEGDPLYYFNEKDLAQELFEEQTGEDIAEMNSKYDCLEVNIETDCFFNQGNWHDIEHDDLSRLKIQFID